jgi:hypothetical protein
MAQVSDAEVAKTVIRDFNGNLKAAFIYCAAISAVDGPLATQYENAKRIIQSRINDCNEEA